MGLGGPSKTIEIIPIEETEQNPIPAEDLPDVLPDVEPIREREPEYDPA